MQKKFSLVRRGFFMNIKTTFHSDVNIISSTPEEISVLNELGEDYKQYSEMSEQDRAFLNTLVLRKQPQRLLELGVCSGGSSLVLLNAIKNINNAHLYSIDYNTQHYRIKDKLTGFYVDNFPELKNKWTLKTGGLALDFMEEIGGDIDFCLIDTVHSNPGEILDFLMVLPYLKKDATVVFHDTNLQCCDNNDRTNNTYLCITNNLLMSSITGNKLIPDNKPYKSEFDFYNIGAIELNEKTQEHIWEIFNLLTIKWRYQLKDEELKKISQCFNKFYGEYYSEYFDRVVEHQRKIKLLDTPQKKPTSPKEKNPFIKKVFSAKNCENHKVISILGIKIKLKRNKNITFEEQIQKINKLIHKKEKDFNVKIRRIIPRPYLDSIGFHLVDHCNLNCKCCDVCSPIAEERFVTLESFVRDIKRLKELSKGNIRQISLSGGEPLLNPHILKIIEAARESFPNSIIRLQSNGILLLKQDESFWKNLKRWDILVTCTKYPIKLDYDKIKNIALKYEVKFNYFNNEEVIKTSYHIPFDINGQQDPRENFLNCFHANHCIGIHDGKIFTCSPAANAQHFNKYFNVNMNLDAQNYIDIHKASSMEEILDFLAKPIPFCRYCNVKGRTFDNPWAVSKKEIEEWI